MTYGRLAQLVEHLLDVQEVTGSSPVPSTKTTRLIRVGSFCFGGRYRTRTARAERSEGNQSPSGALISARFPTPRNVYRDDCRFVVGGTGREPERAKAGYHYGSGILPFAILNRVWYTRLSSTNLHLED